MATAFPLFNDLPLELRQLVWHFSLPADEPEVFLLRMAHLTTEDDPSEPMTVDTAFPVLMHVCRESRDWVLQHSGTRFRSSTEAGGCEVVAPFRRFLPELDTMYWDRDVQERLWAVMYTNTNVSSWLSQLLHVAIPGNTTSSTMSLTDCIISFCPELRSLSVVFPDSRDDNRVGTVFVAPERRCQLRQITPDQARTITVVCDTWADPEDRTTLKCFLDVFCGDLDWHGASSIGWIDNYVGKPWSTTTDSFENLRIFGSTFVEWRRGEWVEVCGESIHIDRSTRGRGREFGSVMSSRERERVSSRMVKGVHS